MFADSKVVIGPLIADDAQLVYQWINAVDLARDNGFCRPVDAMGFAPWYANIGKDQSKVFFAIRTTDDNRLVGYIAINDIHTVFRSAELGVIIGEAQDRGQGLGAQALGLAMQYCWNDLNLERLTINVYGPNEAAIRCYEKAGFEREGVLRSAAFVNGERVDITVMGALNPASQT